MRRNFLGLFIVGLMVMTVSLWADDQILISDFEGADYGGWKVEGDAFGAMPAKGTLKGQMAVGGYEGNQLVNTYFKGDGSTGTLTSPDFRIERNFINFLIGGGKHKKTACINLLIDGKIVRTATGPNGKPGGTEDLSWSRWDVEEFIGKTAVIQIVDQEKGPWGHINIDQIFQSDKVVHLISGTGKVFRKKYLNLPIKEGAPKHRIDIFVKGKLVRQFVIQLATDDIDYWMPLDISEFKGERAILKSTGTSRTGIWYSLLEQSNVPKEADTYYKEKDRQQFHFSSQRGWNNDSNGMVYYNGQYHLFYQHNPFGWAWGNMTWGHAVSKDMIHWQEIGDAIHPDEMGTIFSGSAVVDDENVAGFKTGKHSPIICFYTSAGGTNEWSRGVPFTQSIAYSNDNGKTWTKYKGNPVVEFIAKGNRDPKVIWHEETQKWVMVLYLKDSVMQFLTSDDLKNWTKQSTLKSFHECPELFQLAVDGNASNKKWILYGAKGSYFIGDFDGKKFTPETEEVRFHYGNCFYASQTFSNMPDDRRVQIAWGRVNTPGMPFNQCMLFPVELELKSTDQGLKMIPSPIREIEKLYSGKKTLSDVTLDPAKPIKLAGGELFHIKAAFDIGSSKEFGFNVHGVTVNYNVEKQELKSTNSTGPLKHVNGKVTLELLVDRTTLEIFGNSGELYMPVGKKTDKSTNSIEIYTKGGSAKLESIEVHKLRSVWQQ